MDDNYNTQNLKDKAESENTVEIALFQIKQLIIDKLRELGVADDKLSQSQIDNIFDIPSDVTHGDYTTNVAMIYAKELKMSPKALAEKIVTAFELAPLSKTWGGVGGGGLQFQIAGPGFINIKLGEEIVRSAFNNIGNVRNEFTGRNVLVEHSSPNLFKPFSVGHLMNNIIGEATQRLAVAFGANVETMSFPSDISLGIAKAMMIVEREVNNGTADAVFLDYLRKSERDDNVYKNLSRLEVDTCIKYLGDSYVRGVAECENESVLSVAKDILDKLYNSDKKENKELYNLFIYSRYINEFYFRIMLYKLGTSRDFSADSHKFIYESQAGTRGTKIIIDNIEEQGLKRVFEKGEESDNGFKPYIYIPDESRKDIHTSVFINSQGYPTYEAKDLGLINIKMTGGLSIADYDKEVKIQKPEYSFTVTDAEQIPHFKVVFDAALAIAKYNEDHNRDVNVYGDWREWIKRSHHIPHGRMMFKGQKMSSRLGGVPLALDVIEVVKDEAREILDSNNKLDHKNEEEKSKIAFEVAMSALRIAVLRAKPGININFDPDTSLSFEGDSGPYLLYTHARCSSLIDKGWERFGDGVDMKTFIEKLDFDININANELESSLLHYNDALISCVKYDNGEVNVEPQKLVSYLFKVAREFNSFYSNTQIISDNKITSMHNLKIVLWTKYVMKQGLHILGIEAQERM